MDANYEAFVLYYTAFHAWEINTKEFKEMLINDIGEEGLGKAIVIFREEREKRVAAGDKRLLDDVLKAEKKGA